MKNGPWNEDATSYRKMGRIFHCHVVYQKARKRYGETLATVDINEWWMMWVQAFFGKTPKSTIGILFCMLQKFEVLVIYPRWWFQRYLLFLPLLGEHFSIYLTWFNHQLVSISTYLITFVSTNVDVSMGTHIIGGGFRSSALGGVLPLLGLALWAICSCCWTVGLYWF